MITLKRPIRSSILTTFTRSFYLVRPLLNVNDNFDFLASPDELNKLRTLQEQLVRYRPGGFSFGPRTLDAKYRTGGTPLYIGPLTKQIALAKKLTLTFGVIGVYVTKILFDIELFLPEVNCLILLIMTLPYPLVQFFSSSYVVSIYRLYDSSKPQTLENLTNDETLVISKLNYTGRRPVNNVVKLDSIDLKLGKLGWQNWCSRDPSTSVMRNYYVEDNTGGIAMDRIWGIVESQNGVNNGRDFLTSS